MWYLENCVHCVEFSVQYILSVYCTVYYLKFTVKAMCTLKTLFPPKTDNVLNIHRKWFRGKQLTLNTELGRLTLLKTQVPHCTALDMNL